MQRRFNYLHSSTIYQAATVLDPQVKLSFTGHQKEGKVFIFSSADVKQSVKSLLPTFIPTNAKPRQDEANTGSQPPSSKKPRLLDFCSIDGEGVETDANDVDMEL